MSDYTQLDEAVLHQRTLDPDRSVVGQAMAELARRERLRQETISGRAVKAAIASAVATGLAALATIAMAVMAYFGRVP